MDHVDVLLVGYEEGENLGMRYIAAYLERQGVSCEIVNYDMSVKNRVLRAAVEMKPNIIGFSLIFQRMLPDFAELIALLRSRGIECHFTMGGHFPSANPHAILTAIPGLDSVVIGEGEYTTLELWREINDKNDWRHIPGIAFRKGGEVVLSEPRPLIPELDELPFPKRKETVDTHRGLGIGTLLGSRGCYYNCSFCSVRKFYQTSPGALRRSRSPANVVAEMCQMYDNQGIRIFIFEDDDFLAKNRQQRAWVGSFLDELRDTPLYGNILWRMSCRIDDMDFELLARMKEAGLTFVYTGIESGNEQGLRTCNKHYGVQDVFAGLDVLRELSLPYEFGFMILNPDSTLQSVKEDIAFLKQVNEDKNALVQFTKMMPYAGTPIAQRLKQEHRLEGSVEAPDYEFNDPRVRWLQEFFSLAFHQRNFDRLGFVELARYTKLDVMAVRTFFSGEYDGESYWADFRELIYRGNAVCLEKASMAVNFMMRLTEDQIMEYWGFLEQLARQEKEEELRICDELMNLMRCHGFS